MFSKLTRNVNLLNMFSFICGTGEQNVNTRRESSDHTNFVHSIDEIEATVWNVFEKLLLKSFETLNVIHLHRPIFKLFIQY